MTFRLFTLALMACCSLGWSIGLGEVKRNPCEAPDDAAGIITSLPHVAAALKPGSTLSVLAVGSATLFGPEASLQPGTVTSQAAADSPQRGTVPPAQVINTEPSELAFPRQMARALEVAVPGASVRITVRGGRGLSAADMLKLLRASLAEATYQLVLWQTGTVEAVRNIPPGEFAQTLAEGAEAVREAHADLVLIDPQFSRFLQTNSNLDPYEQAFQQVGSMAGVLLFHRFDLMRTWANEGQIDLERTAKPNRQRVVETLHACLGAHLARMVLGGARS
jgi:acyl-CoA thioesterase-1